MIVTESSSTALPGDKTRRRSTVVSSSEGIIHGIGIVPLSEAETHRPTVTYGGDFTVALKKYLARAPAAGLVTYRYSGEPFRWLVAQSPTLRLRADAFEPVPIDLFRNVGWKPYGLTAVVDEVLAITTFCISRHLGAAAQPIKPLPGLVNATDPSLDTSRLVALRFAEAAAFAEQEWFEDGVESAFSRTLSTLLHMYGDATVAAAETFLGSPTSNTEVAVEMAQWLGEVDHPASQRYRRTLLEKLLSSPSTRIRHGAAVGLAAMDDPSSVAALRNARDREANRRLQKYLELVVDQLERTSACRSS